MRNCLSKALVVAALAVLMSGCGDDAEDAANQVEQGARDVVTSVARGAEAATRLKATLTGAAEIPAGDPNGTGTANVNIDASKGEVCYEVSVQNLDRPTGMHIHEGEAGKNGSIVVQMSTPTATGTTTQGCTNADAALVGRLVATPDKFYVNVHTDVYPQGAIRGQLAQ